MLNTHVVAKKGPKPQSFIIVQQIFKTCGFWKIQLPFNIQISETNTTSKSLAVNHK